MTNNIIGGRVTIFTMVAGNTQNGIVVIHLVIYIEMVK